MTFITLIALAGGLLLIFSGIENISLADYAKSWIGGS